MKQIQPFSVIYSDNDIIVFNKKSGLLVAADRYDKDAPRLDVLAQKEFGELLAVHRIDKDTSGLIVYAKNPESHKNLSMQFEQRKVEKTYHALIYGRPSWTEFRADQNLQPDGDDRHRTVVNKRFGKPSITDFRLIGTCGPYSWVEAKPLTGRTHQIRAQAALHNHPLLGDTAYNGIKIDQNQDFFLHAQTLILPKTNDYLLKDIKMGQIIEAHLPKNFENFISVYF